MKRFTVCILAWGCGLCSFQAWSAPAASTLQGGHFDDYLLLAADHKGNTLSGYYNDGLCRFAFRGKLQPVELAQRSNFGEAYSAQAVVPGKKQAFDLEIYSRAIDSYQTQITMEPGQDKPPACRHRITLDRENHVGNSLLEVRVVRRSRLPLYQISRKDKKPFVLRLDKKPPSLKAYTGVWVAATYSDGDPPPGYVYINWYAPRGTAHGGYVREGDLFPQIDLP